jgi:hypothetical protein
MIILDSSELELEHDIVWICANGFGVDAVEGHLLIASEI